MYQWIHDGQNVDRVPHAAENFTGIGFDGHRRCLEFEWKETGCGSYPSRDNGFGWVIECDDKDDAIIVQNHMEREGLFGDIVCGFC